MVVVVRLVLLIEVVRALMRVVIVLGYKHACRMNLVMFEVICRDVQVDPVV
jgi:hypothetical protein